MIIKPVSKDDITNPLASPYGETVYELIGRAVAHGGIQEHSLAYITLAPGKASLPHYHQLSQESYYLLKGAATMRVDGEEYPLAAGQALVILPKQRHQIVNTGTTELEFLAVCVPAWYPEDSFYE